MDHSVAVDGALVVACSVDDLVLTESVVVYCHFGTFVAVGIVAEPVAAAVVDFDYPEDVRTLPT